MACKLKINRNICFLDYISAAPSSGAAGLTEGCWNLRKTPF